VSTGNSSVVDYLISKGAKQQWDKFGLLPINYSTDSQISEKLSSVSNTLTVDPDVHDSLTSVDSKMFAVANKLFNTGN